jgi:ATP-dependent Lon protease
LIRYYTREAGVRGLEREISKICRKVVKEAVLLDKSIKQCSGQSEQPEDFLGVQRFSYGKAEEKDQVGQVTGLAWTEVGGDLLTIEAPTCRARASSLRPVRWGDVMQESIRRH